MIVSTTFDALSAYPEFQGLVDEYVAEAAFTGLPAPNHQPDIYRNLEAAGVLQILASFEGIHLTGFLGLLVTVMPHYGVRLGTTESFFVASRYRKTGAGLKLLREAEKVAQGMGAVGLMVSSPMGGRLAEVLAGSDGYSEINRIFFRRLQ